MPPYISLFSGFLLLVLIAFLLVSPQETVRDLKFVFNPRIIRRGLRWRRTRRKLAKRSGQFSLSFLMLAVTIAALQQAVCSLFTGTNRWVMLVLTTLAIFVFFAVASLTACRVPRRIYRDKIGSNASTAVSLPPAIEIDS